MGSFGQDFSQGLALGVNMYDNAQREKRQDQEQQWKAEDRQREEQDRKDDRAFGNVWGKAMDGDFSPAIAMANMKGSFGPDRYASGFSVDDKGIVSAHVYTGSGDAASAVNSMEKVPLGTMEDVRKSIFNTYAPDRVKAAVAAKIMALQADPEAQQRLQSGALDIARKRSELGILPQKQQIELAQGQAGVDHTRASTAGINQATQQAGLMGPYQVAGAKFEAKIKENQSTSPNFGLKPAGYAVHEDLDSGDIIRTPIYDPNDPRLRPQSLADPGETPGGSSQPKGGLQFGSLNEVVAAVKSGKIKRSEGEDYARNKGWIR